MKSWSLGRSSSKKEKKEKSPARPKSMIMNMPSASSSTELVTSVQASPSLSSHIEKEKSSPESVKSKRGDSSPLSAKRYLSSAQLKDQARREDLGPVTYAATSPTSSRSPLTVRENGQEHGAGHHRKRSIPSLIKSPFRSSPTPATASSTAAIARNIASSEHRESRFNNAHLNHLESNASLSDSASMGSAQVSPSPSGLPLANSSPPRTRLTSITSDLPVRKESNRISKSYKEKDKASRELSLDELKEDQASAVASLRRLKESDTSSLADTRNLEHVDCMSVVESQGSLEEVKERGKPMEVEPAADNPALQVPNSEESTLDEAPKRSKTNGDPEVDKALVDSDIKGVSDDEAKEIKIAKIEAIVDDLTKKIEDREDSLPEEKPIAEAENIDMYPYAIRKSKKPKSSSSLSNTPNSSEEQRNQHARRIEAKMNLAIVTQRHNQIAARYIISTPIPALLSADHLASWTVERVSRITSCIIQIFGS